MSKIYILPDRITNRIAAGEVIERPASVVKELIENSLDAGSKEIIIRIAGDGKKLIEVIDDGCGMEYDDAIISLERHSTSKIKTTEDLEAIATLGFRGEALASIASVSRLTLTTKIEEETAGTKVEVHGGRMINVSRTARERGTTVTVEDLFYKTPARLKFLKSGTTEMRWIVRTVNQYAIVNPLIKFHLKSGQKQLLSTIPVKTLFERIYQLQGKEIVRILLPFEEINNDTKVYGYCSRTDHQRSNTEGLHFFINKRYVNDRMITHAVREAYGNLITAGKFPVVFLFIEIPFNSIDINVHPTKMEVRFRSPEIVHDMISKSIRDALIKDTPILSIDGRKKTTALHDRKAGEVTEMPSSKDYLEFLTKGSPVDIKNIQTADDKFVTESSFKTIEDRADIKNRKELQIAESQTVQVKNYDDLQRYEPDFHRAVQPLKEISADQFKIIGQYTDSFIIFESEGDLFIVDQHVAHERIRYEELKDLYDRSMIKSQNLLIPETRDLSAEESYILERIEPELKELGFEVEPFGSKTWILKAVPGGFEDATWDLVLDIINSSFDAVKQTNKKSLSKSRLTEDVIVTLACHGSIKKNSPLSADKMEWLISSLLKCNEPYRCPHGRPIIVKFDKKEISKKFGRYETDPH